MTWRDRLNWPSLMRECCPLLLVAVVWFLAMLMLWLSGCAPSCFPEQTQVSYVEQPVGCEEQLVTMKQLTAMQAGR